MPIRQQSTQVSKELASNVSFNPLPERYRQLFRQKFEIPNTVSVDGMMFPLRSAIYQNLHTDTLLPLLNTDHINPRSRGPISPAEFSLPPIFESGTLTIGMVDGYEQDHFQTVLRFQGSPDLGVCFQTHPLSYDEPYSILYETAMLAALPTEVLRKVKSDGSMVVIRQFAVEDGSHTGYLHSNLFKLTWDEQTQLIQASKIEFAEHNDENYWQNHVAGWKKAVAESPSVFFVAE